tara:strand:- start:17389 stop:17790 length:402 start_codon:yes stop_codon:yes gene_type:complete
MSYKVGQILYLLSKKEVKIFPALVIEEIRRKTIDQEMVSYILRLPNKDNSEVLLEEIKADVFTSLTDVESQMVKNAHEQIKVFLRMAKDMESTLNASFENGKSETNDMISEDVAEVDLGGGVKGKINLSEIPV